MATSCAMHQKFLPEPHWIDEKDWLCAVELFPTDDPEARLFAADVVGYLMGYARLTNTRSLALVGDSADNAYDFLFSFSSPALPQGRLRISNHDRSR